MYKASNKVGFCTISNYDLFDQSLNFTSTMQTVNFSSTLPKKKSRMEPLREVLTLSSLNLTYYLCSEKFSGQKIANNFFINNNQLRCENILTLRQRKLFQFLDNYVILPEYLNNFTAWSGNQQCNIYSLLSSTELNLSFLYKLFFTPVKNTVKPLFTRRIA